MVVVIFVALMITLTGITCALIGYEFGIRKCAKELEEVLWETTKELDEALEKAREEAADGR